MNSTIANEAPRSELAVQRPLPLPTTLRTLLRRELWEHPALWRAPLIIAALLVGTFIIGSDHGGRHVGVHVDGWDGNMTRSARCRPSPSRRWRRCSRSTSSCCWC